MSEFKPSLAPRNQMNRSFFPFSPMLPSASARFMTIGMSTSEARAAAIPALDAVLRKARRLRMLKWWCCISGSWLLLLKTLHGHQHGDHAAHTCVIGGARVAQRGEEVRRAVVGCVEEVDGQRPVAIKVRLSFARLNDAQEIVCDGTGG